MKLWEYLGKKVNVILIDNKSFIGTVTGFDDEVDNESGENSINLNVGNLIYDFDESEIKSIKVLS